MSTFSRTTRSLATQICDRCCRLTATVFGKTAVDLAAQNQFGQMVAWQNSEVIPFRFRM